LPEDFDFDALKNKYNGNCIVIKLKAGDVIFFR